MTPFDDIPEELKTLAARTRMVSLSEAATHLQHNGAECERVLDRYVERGVLRKTMSRRGQVYYWLATQLEEVEPEA